MNKISIFTLSAIIVILFSGCSMYTNPSELKAYNASQKSYSKKNFYENMAVNRNAGILLAAAVISDDEEDRLFSEDVSSDYLIVSVWIGNSSVNPIYYTGLNELTCNGQKAEPLDAFELAEAMHGHFWLTWRMFTIAYPEGESLAYVMNEKQYRDGLVSNNVFNRSLTAEVIRNGYMKNDFLYFKKPADFDPDKLFLTLTFQTAFQALKYIDLKTKVELKED